MAFTFSQVLELAAIVVAGTMVGNELAVAVFFHPRISALDDAAHVRAAQTLAVALGRAMPFWYAMTLLLSLGATFFAYPAGTAARWLGLVASALFAASIVYTVLLPVPINNQVTRWHPESLPGNWRQLRRRWDKLHALSHRGAVRGAGPVSGFCSGPSAGWVTLFGLCLIGMLALHRRVRGCQGWGCGESLVPDSFWRGGWLNRGSSVRFCDKSGSGKYLRWKAPNRRIPALSDALVDELGKLEHRRLRLAAEPDLELIIRGV